MFEPRIQQELIQVTAEVVDKEYCQARKPENRFKVETHKMNIFQKNKNQNQYLSEEKGDIAGVFKMPSYSLSNDSNAMSVFVNIFQNVKNENHFFLGGRKSVK